MPRQVSWSGAVIGLAFTTMMLGTVAPSYAVREISVKINGNPVTWTSRPSCNDQSKCFDIAGTYGNIVIEPISVGSGPAAYARVELQVLESTGDSLRILNAKIRSTNTANSVPVSIILEREDISLPNTIAPSKIWYNVNLGGTFGDVAGHSITARGYFKGSSSSNNWDEIDQQGPVMTHTVTCSSAGCQTTFSNALLKRGEEESPSNAARWVKEELSITLKPSSNNNAESYVKLNPGSRIITSANPPDIELPPTPTPELSTLCSTTHSTARMFGCPSCVTEDGQVASTAKITLFASINWDNLQQDFARGKGEHLSSLAALLKIPNNQQPEFFQLAQDKYRTSPAGEKPAQLVTSLQATWNSRNPEVH